MSCDSILWILLSCLSPGQHSCLLSRNCIWGLCCGVACRMLWRWRVDTGITDMRWARRQHPVWGSTGTTTTHKMADSSKFFCPRLLDYLVIVGSRHPNRNNSVAQNPEMLRRYPVEDHKDFPLAPDVVFFCQPEGCISIGPKRMSLRETTSFVFTLTEKDTGRTRYGICVNFFRPIERRGSSAERHHHPGHSHERSPSPYAAERSNLNVAVRDVATRSPRSQRKQKTASRTRNNTLTSLCIISHHPFFSTFRECLFILKKLIESSSERCSSRRIGASRTSRNL